MDMSDQEMSVSNAMTQQTAEDAKLMNYQLVLSATRTNSSLPVNA
jgi:hypothetical protein